MLIKYMFLDIVNRPGFLFKVQRFGDWILSQSSSKILLTWAQLIELFGGPEIGTRSIDSAQLSRFLPEDGDRIQSAKRFGLHKKQNAG
jgi:hypothetical protein